MEHSQELATQFVLTMQVTYVLIQLDRNETIQFNCSVGVKGHAWASCTCARGIHLPIQ